VDMDKLLAVCRRCEVKIIEDCAHSLGGKWNGRQVGTFGAAACFSFQTNKLINAGEGGMILTNQDEIAAKAILYSGSYANYKESGAVMGHHSLKLHLLEQYHNYTPNFSMRMTNLTAAIVRPQLPSLKEKIEVFKNHFEILRAGLEGDSLFDVTSALEKEERVHTSLQFRLPSFDLQQMEQFCNLCQEHRIAVAWFGRPNPLGFTSALSHWEYVFANQVHPEDPIAKADSGMHALPATRKIIEKLFDVPLYHTSTWQDADFQQVAAILRACAHKVCQVGCKSRL